MATLIALFITSLATAAPVRNTTQTNLPPQAEPPFVAEPKGRGTFGLLSSCFLTLVVCVWTAIHPNIIHNPTNRRRLIHKALYVILGLFSPEIVLAIAFNEWRAAGNFLHEAHLAGGVAYAQHEIEEAEEVRRQQVVSGVNIPEASLHEFSWECSFFAVMGGFTCSPSTGPSELHSFEPGPSRLDSSKSDEELAVSTEVLAVLLKEGIISVTDLAKLKYEVTDKGKSNMLAKLLVCMQVVWMVVNFLARKVTGLPITLLELNVIMHVACAIIIYSFWYMKPLDAGRPISLSSKFPLSNGTWELVYTMEKYGSRLRASREVPAPTSSTLSSGTGRPAARGRLQGAPTASTSKGHRHEDQHRGFIVTDPDIITKRDLEICAVAAQALRTLMGHSQLVTTDPEQNISDEQQRYPLRNSNIKMVSNSTKFIPWKITWLLIPLCLIYGGVHASAWNSHFPTPIERLLWRVSCAIVAVPGFGTITVWFFERAYNSCKTLKDVIQHLLKVTCFLLMRFLFFIALLFLILLPLGCSGGILYLLAKCIKRESHHKVTNWLVYIIFTLPIVTLSGIVGAAAIASKMDYEGLDLLIAVLLTVIYCAARVYIVVESFISLRSLPYGAFKTISWDNVWPHL